MLSKIGRILVVSFASSKTLSSVILISACEKIKSKKDIMSSKSKDDDHPLTSFKTMPLLSQYYQSIVSVQFTSGWREYWGVMDQNKIYLCDTPCLDFSTSARVVLELTEETKVQGYGNAISRRNKFCFILAPTMSSQTSRDNYHSIWRFTKEGSRANGCTPSKETYFRFNRDSSPRSRWTCVSKMRI